MQVVAGSRATVPFSVSVPDDAAPGDHVAGWVIEAPPKAGAAGAVWQAQDARGTGDGWNVTLSSTGFTGASTISVDNFKVRQPQAQVVTVGGNTAPSSQVLSFQALSGVPLKLLSATGGAGMGTYDYTPDFQLTVPASTAAGAYTANVTVTINSGP